MKCYCGAQAVVLATTVECSNPRCRHFHKPMRDGIMREVFPNHDKFYDKNFLNREIAKGAYKHEEIKRAGYNFEAFCAYCTEYEVDGIEHRYTFYFSKLTLAENFKKWKKYKEENPNIDLQIRCECCPGGLLILPEHLEDYVNLFNLFEHYGYEPFYSWSLNNSFMVCGRCAPKVKSLKI